MNMYNILDRLKELAAKDPHYADAAHSAEAMGHTHTVLEGVSGETCNECGMYESHCECPDDKEVMEAQDEHMEEGNDPDSQKFGRAINQYFGEIYAYGDDGLDYLDRYAPFWLKLFLKHDGDIDTIIANEPATVLKKAALELKQIANDLPYELGEASVGEGNEFSGELAKAKAAGAKEFKVDGKTYPVKEDAELTSLLRHAGVSQLRTESMSMQVDTVVESIKNTKNILNESAQVNEKWAGDAKVKATGEYAGKTVAELQKSLAALKKSGPHKEGSAENKRMKQIQFAIRSKKDWKGGVSESAEDDHEEVVETQEKKTHKGGTVKKTDKGTEHRGKYGTDYQGDDSDDDDDDSKSKKAKKDAGEKRGRGRPKKADSEKTSARLPKFAKGAKTPKAAKGTHVWGMRGGEKFDKAIKESQQAVETLIQQAAYKNSYIGWKQACRKIAESVGETPKFKGTAELAEARVAGLPVGVWDGETGVVRLDERAVSRAQQRFMGMVHAAQKGEKAASPEVAKVAKGMKKSDAEDFAKTKHKGLPEKVKEEGEYDDADRKEKRKWLAKDHDKLDDLEKKAVDKAKADVADRPKKEEKVDETTTSGSVAVSGGESKGSNSSYGFGKGVYESYEEKLAQLDENITISTNQSTEGGDSITVTATDEDAHSLADLLKMAGINNSQYQQYQPQGDCGEQSVQEDLANAPDQQVGTTDQLVNRSSGGLNGQKLQYARGYAGDNDITALGENLWKEYSKR